MGRLKSISKYRPSIFQGRLDLSPTKHFSIAAAHPIESLIMRSLLVILVCLGGAYLYFVGASVLNVVARKEAAAESARLSSAIASMEAQYISLAQAVDESIAPTLGLEKLAQTQYVHRPGKTAAATIATNGNE